MKLLLLHGAIGAACQMVPLADKLAEKYDVSVLEFSGHGATSIDGQPFSIELFARNVLDYLDKNNIDKISILGYSMGGYVAMYLARYYPNRVAYIITLATKYSWDEEIAAREIKMLDAEKIAQKLPQFATTLQQRHTAIGWIEVLARTRAMMIKMGADNPLKVEDFADITHNILVAIGDRDKMVSMDETIAVYKALPTAQLCIIPNTGHPVEQLDVAQVYEIVSRFLK